MSKNKTYTDPIMGIDLSPAEDFSAYTTPAPTPTIITGVVSSCGSLRMRSTPAVEDWNIINELPITTELQVDIANSTEEFYKVTTADGMEGYCMKKFVNLAE